MKQISTRNKGYCLWKPMELMERVRITYIKCNMNKSLAGEHFHTQSSESSVLHTDSSDSGELLISTNNYQNSSSDSGADSTIKSNGGKK